MNVSVDNIHLYFYMQIKFEFSCKIHIFIIQNYHYANNSHKDCEHAAI